MHVLVTGGAGFVGTHIVKKLVADGYEVDVIDWKKPNWVIEGARYTLKNARDLHGGDTDCVVHCAATADIKGNWTMGRGLRGALWHNNVDLTMSLLETYAGKPFIFISTMTAYSPGSSIYAASKAAGESLVKAFAARYGNRYHILRLGSCVGIGYHNGHIVDFVEMMREEGKIRPKSTGLASTYVHVGEVADTVAKNVRDSKCRLETQWVGGTLWSPRDTVALMGVPDVVWPDNEDGWVGDVRPSICAAPSGWSVEKGVRETLEYLGWET